MDKLRNGVRVEAARETIACGDCGVYELCAPLGVDEQVDAVLDTIVKRRVTFHRGDLLYGMGQPFEHVYALRSGSVKTYVATDDGRVQITGFHLAGELLGLNAMTSRRHTSEARALETTMACEVAVDKLEDLAKRKPELQQAMIRIMSDEIEHHQELMLLLGKKTADERIATYLLGLSRRFARRQLPANAFHLSMSRGDIGNYLGIAEETVCRVLSRFQDEGLVDIRHRDVGLKDLKRLAEICHDHHSRVERLAAAGGLRQAVGY
ncbi:MAG TPA: fumarate/nitrate reduction transcriptional regulator Fnr [Burkholderiales bacterium]|nr:fumarate/nitrate reduction transcriptional regulator Fnr [Burkholderiales bacterium]